MNNWRKCKHILVVRADNIGDLVMSSPAIRAVKNTFNCRITLLASQSAAAAVELIPEIDETITADLPWVKKESNLDAGELIDLSKELKARSFDGAIIFTVFSQSAWAAALLVWMAGIPLRLAYSRENPYDLLNYWYPDKEPYGLVKHQVERDLDLVRFIGADTAEDQIKLSVSNEAFASMGRKLKQEGLDPQLPFLVFHAGVSEEKRKFSFDKWVAIAKATIQKTGIPILLTGSKSEQEMALHLQEQVGSGCHALAGKFSLVEFAALIKKATLVLSVNTSTIHLAAGLQTPVIVLYAQSNPQHHPWKVKSQVFEYSVPSHLGSKNEVIRYVNENWYAEELPEPEPEVVVRSVVNFLGRL